MLTTAFDPAGSAADRADGPAPRPVHDTVRHPDAPHPLEIALAAACARAAAAEHALQAVEAELRLCAAELATGRIALSAAHVDLDAAHARATLLARTRDVAVIAARRACATDTGADGRRRIAILQQRAHAAEVEGRDWQQRARTAEAERLDWQQRAAAADAQCLSWQQQAAGAEARNAALCAELLASEQRYADLRARLAQLLRRVRRAVRLVPKPVRQYARSRIVKWSKD